MARQQSEYQKTFNDLLMQIAGPALIMLLVGSLVFFMAHVFYEGQYPGRVFYVFGLFTFASVLISRISIEEGLERAFFYGVALGLVTWFVSCFFLQLPGALAPLSFVVNGLFIAFVWWCASRLTWDCTVNDSSRDVSSTGLIELVRRKMKKGTDAVRSLDPADRGSDRTPEQDALPVISVQDSATERAEADTTNMPWDKKILSMWPFKRKKNTPGLWIVYFSLMAVPIFGLGQAFIPAGRVDDRRYAFTLFVVYVAAALGLLMMTSLMGLQRYLKRRNTAMPDSIAKTWMIFGTVIGIVVLTFVWLLPRPAPEYSVTQALPKFMTPDRNTSRWGWGKEGKQNESDANRTENKDDATQTRSKKNAKNEGGNAKNNQQSGGGERSKQKSKSGKSSKSQSKSQSQGSKNKDKSTGSKSQSKSQSQGSKNKDKSTGSKSQSKSSGSKKSGKQSESKPGQDKQPERRPGKESQPGKDKMPNQGSLDSFNEKRKDRAKKNESRAQGSRQNPGSNQNSRNSNRPPPVKNPPPPPTNQAPNLNAIGTLATLIKWISILILLVVIATFAYFYRNELLASLRSFIDGIREFFANLFGNKTRAENPIEVDEQGQPIVPVRPFAAYRDPFASGAAAGMNSSDIVVYTFDAFQAWGRLYHCPRLADQTPHEYSRRLSRVQTAISRRESDAFADLVCQELFGPAEIEREQLETLKALWQTMRKTAPVPTVPATNALAPAQ